MLAYLTIFATAMAGYTNAPAWIIPLAALALSMISVFEHRATYIRASRLGFSREAAASTLAMSLLNSLVASTGSFLIGVLIGMTS